MMPLAPECVPCALAGALRTIRATGAGEEAQVRVLKETLQLVASSDFSRPAPLLGRDIQRLVRRLTGCDDPFAAIKASSNERMLALLPRLREVVATDPDPLGRALGFSAMANTIDFGPHVFDTGAIEALFFGDGLRTFDRCDRQTFDEALADSERIVVLLDNAGEIVADRLLIEQLGPERVTAIVRGGPTLNDVTLDDAHQAGITSLCHVVDTGVDMPGFPCDDVPESLSTIMDEASLVVSKGQGNYEMLEGKGPRLFFLLVAKCVPVARRVGVPLGSLVFFQDDGACQ